MLFLSLFFFLMVLAHFAQLDLSCDSLKYLICLCDFTCLLFSSLYETCALHTDQNSAHKFVNIVTLLRGDEIENLQAKRKRGEKNTREHDTSDEIECQVEYYFLSLQVICLYLDAAHFFMRWSHSISSSGNTYTHTLDTHATAE